MLVWLAVAVCSGCGTSPPSDGVLDATVRFERDAISDLPQQPTYRIGIHTEVTGSGAQIGDLSIRAARLAVEEINARGGVGGIPLELVVRDCRSDIATAIAEYRAAVAEDQLVALLGPVKSAYAVPMVQEHRGEPLPLLIGATNTRLTEQGDAHLFRLRPSIRVAAAAMVALAVEQLDARRIGIIFDSDPHGSNGAEQIAAELARRERTPTVQLSYTTATSDYDPLARQLLDAQVDAVFIYGTNPTDIGRLLRAIRYRNLNVQIITSPGGSSFVTHNVAGDAQDGVYTAIDALLDGTPTGRRFEQAFRQRFGLQPDTYITWYYDAVYLLADVLAQQPYPPDPARLSDAIRRTQFTGAQGVYRFDAVGEVLQPMTLARMLNGKPQVIGVYGADQVVNAVPPKGAAP